MVPTIFAIVCRSHIPATSIQSRYNKPHAEYVRGWVECESLYARYVQERYSEGFEAGYAAANDDRSEKEI